MRNNKKSGTGDFKIAGIAIIALHFLHYLGVIGIVGGIIAFLVGNSARGVELLIGGVSFFLLRFAILFVTAGGFSIAEAFKKDDASEKKPFALRSNNTMTICEAERIMEIYGDAIDETIKIITKNRAEHRETPDEQSEIYAPFLQGLNKFQITTAVNLRIAYELLLLTKNGGVESNMERKVKIYCGGLVRLMTIDIGEESREQIYPSKFYSYCKKIGSNDPMFWQKIYTKLGLEYTHLSPQKNWVERIDYSDGFER